MELTLYALIALPISIILLFLSSFFGSINIVNSSYNLMLQSIYGGVFFLSYLTYLKKGYISKFLMLSFCLAVLLFIGQSIAPSFFTFLTDDSFQFILRVNGEHNHLGDLAGIAFLGALLHPEPVFFIIPFLIFDILIVSVSFSKSAFLGIFCMMSILAIRKRGWFLFSFFLVSIFSFFIVAVYTSEFSSISFISSSQRTMKHALHLNPKSILSVRDSYYPQVIRAWKSAPLEQLLFGYGPGNYIYSSVRTGATTALTPAETHNIFLSIFIESGFLSAFWFFIFCILIIGIGIKNKDPLLYLFVYLLLNFQTDYTYKIPFFMIIFFIVAGQIAYKAKNNKDPIRPSIKILFGIITICIVYSCFTYASIAQKKKGLELKLNYALEAHNNVVFQKTITQLEYLTPYEEASLVEWSHLQELKGNNMEAIRLLEKLSVYSPRWYLLYFTHLLTLMNKEQVNLKKYLESKKKIFATFPYTVEEKKELNHICEEYAKMKCID